ncbi:UNVERIFIED_CONTAM: hypothetical protein RMT77_018804, partial [Armadillidium vulgare]
IKSLINSGEEITHFAFGQSPFPPPEVLIEALREHSQKYSYLPIKGTLELRKGISRMHSKYDQLNLDPENIIVGPGTKELLFLILNAFNGVILLASPSWTTYEQQCNLAGKIPLVLKTDKAKGWKLTPQTITEGLKSLPPSFVDENKLLILTNPGNPTGTCYTSQELEELSASCRQNRILVISDEIYSRLTFSNHYDTMLKFYPEGTIMTNGFSKWASVGGWRLGYAYFPPSLKTLFEAVYKSASNTYSCAPTPMQYAIAQVLEENAIELDLYMKSCSAILSLVGGFCARELSSVGVTGHQSEAGYYFIADFEVIRSGLAKRGIFTGVEMTEALLQEARVALMSNTMFLLPPEDLTVRFCFVCFDGSKALRAYQNLQENCFTVDPFNDLGKEFIEKNCQNLVQGLERLKNWVKKHS